MAEKGKNGNRNYRAEYDSYHGTEKQKEARAQRNAARREAEREGKVHKGDGKDVAHKTAIKNGGTNADSNLKVQDKEDNRGWRAGQKKYRVPNEK